jgi:hypothetical protein
VSRNAERGEWVARACVACCVAIFLGFVASVLFSRGIGRNLNHDEHQFVAPAVLLCREGIQPYRDYPLFHLPNLVLVNAALIRYWNQPLMVGRCLSIASGFAMVLLVFREAWQIPSLSGRAWRFAAALGAVAFLIFDPLFSFTTGRAWNHDLAAVFTILAVLFQVRAARHDSFGHVAASAVCVGLAVGTRLTYAPIIVPLWASIWFFPGPLRRRVTFGAVFLAGVGVALGPSLFYLFTSPNEFIFGNFEFPRLRSLDPNNERIRKTMHPLRKMRFFVKEVALPSLPLFLAFAAISVQPGWRWLRGRSNRSFATALILAILPFALLGCFAPSRYQYQHFFVVTPLLVLGLVYAIGSLESSSRVRILVMIGLLFCCVTNSSIGIYKSHESLFPGPSREWFPNRVRQVGQRVRESVTVGPVLTLAPIYPLEGGLSIYPEFATGPFGWRSAPFASKEVRRRMGLVAPDDLEAFLRGRPPGGILTGVEEDSLEKPFVSYARAHEFRAVDIGKRRTLWLPPESVEQAGLQ